MYSLRQVERESLKEVVVTLGQLLNHSEHALHLFFRVFDLCNTLRNSQYMSLCDSCNTLCNSQYMSLCDSCNIVQQSVHVFV